MELNELKLKMDQAHYIYDEELAVVLFVIDVFVRKTRWREIRGFFRKKKRKETPTHEAT